MGMLLIVLGVASAGLVADFVFENHLASAPVESFTLIGSSLRMSVPALVLSAFIAGVMTLLLVKVGLKFVHGRRERRRVLRRRLADLERENAELRTDQAGAARPAERANDTLPAAWVAPPRAEAER